jgi:hypothetical protein
MKEDEMDGACGTHGRGEKCIQNFLIGKPEVKRPLERPTRRWEDNIRMYLREIELKDVDLSGSE